MRDDIIPWADSWPGDQRLLIGQGELEDVVKGVEAAIDRDYPYFDSGFHPAGPPYEAGLKQDGSPHVRRLWR